MPVAVQPEFVVAATFAGQMIVGLTLSITVTVNEQVDIPTAFVAVAVTVVVPTGNNVPGFCE